MTNRIRGSAYIGAYTYHTCESDEYDAVGDVRYYGDDGQLIIQKCTVANGAKGGGTWVDVSPFAKYYQTAAPDVNSVNVGDVWYDLTTAKEYRLIDDGTRWWLEITPPDFENAGELSVDTINVKDPLFGAEGDGVTDDTAAIQAAIDYAESISEALQGRVNVHFPGGSYYISSTITINANFIVLTGDGHRSTTIKKYGDYGDVFHFTAIDPTTTSLSGVGIKDMLIRAYSDTNSGAGVRFTRCLDLICSNVFVRNNFGGILIEGGLQHFYENINVTAGDLWSAVKVGSYGLKLTEGVAAQQLTPADIFFTNINIRNTGSSAEPWIDYGIIVNSVDGIWIANGHTLSCRQNGVRIEPITTTLSPTGSQITGIVTSNFWFDGYCLHSLFVTGSTTKAFGGFHFSNSFFLNANRNAVNFASGMNAKGVTFTGGTVLKSGRNGMILNDAENVIISNLFISGNNQDNGGYSGVILQGACKGVLINGNRIGGKLLGGTETTQENGVYINSATADDITITNNIFSGHVLDVKDTPGGLNKLITDNITDMTITGIGTVSDSLQIHPTGAFFEVLNTVATITNLIHRYKNRAVTLLFTGNCTVTHGAGQLELAGSANFSATSGDMLSLIYTGTKWVETSRTII